MSAANNDTWVGWTPSPNTRGTSDILWSCLLIFVACTWTILHLNIPPPKQKAWHGYLDKAKWMLVTAVAPEYILGDACMEWLLARRSVAPMLQLGFLNWTEVHGFFANMGGFAVVASDGTYRALVEAELEWLVRNGHVHPFPLSKEEIRDRSKANLLVKLIACGQVLYFVLQCAARLATGTTVTPLEVATAGFVVCSVFMYAFWMDKPLDVDTPTVLPDKVNPAALLDMAAAIKPPRSVTNYVENAYLAGREEASLAGLSGTGYDLYVTCVLGTVLGAIHAAGWYLPFPSYIECVLWRVASVVTTALPAVLFVSSKVFKLLASTKLLIKIESCLVLVVVGLYALGRAYLLAASLAALRYLPADAYSCVQWTQVFPHL